MSRRTDIPPMPLCNGCGKCCGPATATRQEAKRIKRYIEDEDILWESNSDKPVDCGFLRDAGDGVFRCAVYEVRPWVCRAFGVFKELECPVFPEAVVGSYPARQAVLDNRIHEDDKFLGEYFEPGYLERMFKYITEDVSIGTFNGHGVLPANVTMDLAFRVLVVEYQRHYPGPITTIMDRLPESDRQILHAFILKGMQYRNYLNA